MTNPNNAIGTNGAYSGRTSVDAFNDVLSAFSGRGIISGWSVSPSSGMTITLGGVSGIRDVAIAVATGGAKTTINNRSGSPVSLTIEAAPATNSRIDAIVAYVSNPPQGTTELADNPSACGLIAVKGTVASTPTAPTESTIRTAITADGAVGSTAYYVVLGTVKVVAGVTTLTSNYITQGARATIGTDQIADSAVTTAKIASSAVTSDKIDFTTLGFKKASISGSTWKSLTTTETSYASLTIGTSGTYMLLANAYVDNSSANGTSLFVYAGTTLAKMTATTITGYQTLTVIGSYGITAGTTVFLKASSSSGRILVDSSRTGLFAIRVA